MRAANAPSSPLLAAWRCWLVLLMLGYAALIVVLATEVVPAAWRGSGIARPAALLLLASTTCRGGRYGAGPGRPPRCGRPPGAAATCWWR
jgi:hypothetical protein